MRRLSRDGTISLEFRPDGSVRRLKRPPRFDDGPEVPGVERYVLRLPTVPPPAPPRVQRVRRSRAAAPAPAAPEPAAPAIRLLPGLRLPAGRILMADPAGLVVVGPLGAVSGPLPVVRALAVLAASGRHPEAALMAAGGWREAEAMRAAFDAFTPRLAATGLTINRRKTGWRITHGQ